MVPEAFSQLGISLGLGLLIGLQRERVGSKIGGIRTYPLFSLLGTVCALIGGWVVAAGLLGVTAVLVVGNVLRMRGGDVEPGQTSEAAALLTFAIGAWVVPGSPEVVVATGVVVALLLYFKEPMHAFVHRIGEQDVRAILQFALISLVILPVLPDGEYGPYGALNPRKIWLMVVLIVGLGLSGYVAWKLFGERAGTVLGGVLGGLISSTATTVTYARRTAENPASVGLGALLITIAATVAFVRVVVEVAVVAPHHLRVLGPPLGLMWLWMVVLAAALALFERGRPGSPPEHGNPAEMKSALAFAAIYAVVSLAVAAGRDWFGARGLYVVGLVSGLTDVDAITLSTAQLVDAGRLPATTAWRVILLAAMANLVFKLGAVAWLGHRRLTLRMTAVTVVALAGGGLLLAVWPDAEWGWVDELAPRRAPP